MTLSELNSNDILEEGVISFLKKLVNNTKKFKDGTSDEEKKKYALEKVSLVTKAIADSAPKLRKWDDAFTLGDKLSNTQVKKVIDTSNAIIGKMGSTLLKSPEKTLNMDIEKVAAAILGNSLKKVTGQKEWSEASWLTMIATKIL